MLYRRVDDFIGYAASKTPNIPYVKTRQGVWSYKEVFDAVRKLASALKEIGVSRNSRVVLIAENHPFFAVSYYAVSYVGGTIVPINFLYSPVEIKRLILDIEPSAIVVQNKFLPKLDDIHRQYPLILFEHDQGFDQGDSIVSILDEYQPLEKPCDAAEVAVILYTSGMTGVPKGAMLTHENICSNVESVKVALNIARGEVMLVVLPLFHAFAATTQMHGGAATSSTLVLSEGFHPVQVAEEIRKEKVTIFMGVPSMYNMLSRLPAEQYKDYLSSLKVCVSGGAALPGEVHRRFKDNFGKEIYEGDGPTECSPVTSVNPIGGRTKPGSIGLPIPGVEMAIMDEEGRELPFGHTGEICVRGPNVFKGYWKRNSDTLAAFHGEWFKTGDVGWKDEEGYFYIVDRIKDMIIVNGMNVYPRMVEEVLYRHHAVAEVAVVGEPHKLHGEVPVAYVVLKEGKKTTPKELQRFCSKHLARFELPRRFYFRDSLPKTPAGKIFKRMLDRRGEAMRGFTGENEDDLK